MKTILLLLVSLLAGCTGIPEGIKAVDGFDVNRYLGNWYEIARLDHRFERGLDNISATYTLRKDGGIDVVNKGRNSKTGKWEQAQGKAYFVEQPTIGRLKVSFFGPFYGGYNIIKLDKTNYAYSVVSGPDRSYFWILSRTKILSPPILQTLIEEAKAQGFATDQLIFSPHD